MISIRFANRVETWVTWKFTLSELEALKLEIQEGNGYVPFAKSRECK